MPSFIQVLKATCSATPDLSTEPGGFYDRQPGRGRARTGTCTTPLFWGVELGMFYKRRDYSRVVDGRNPIIAHEYLGSDVAGKDAFISDDIISSGESMLDIAYNLKERKASASSPTPPTPSSPTDWRASLTRPIGEGVIDGVFGSNLTYRSGGAEEPALVLQVDVSKLHRLLYLRSEPRHVRFAMIDPTRRSTPCWRSGQGMSAASIRMAPS